MNKLTVVIPTDGRYTTLGFTVSNVQSLHTVAQIIIVDSSISDPPKNIINQIKSDSRIIHIKTDNTFNAVQNFNYAIKEVNSHYCIFIGDDDILMNEVDKIISYLLEEDVDAITCSFPVSYHWPGYRTKNQGEKLGSSLVIKQFTGNITRYENPRKELASIAERSSFLGPQHLPRIYLGIVKTSVLKEIEALHGSVFGGVSPDIYSSSLVAWYIKNYCVIDYPLIVPGAAPSSTSALSAENKHQGNFYKSQHLLAFENLKWLDSIPKYYSTETVWSYSMQMALKNLNGNHEINYKTLYKSFSIDDKEFLKILFDCSMQNKSNLALSSISVIMSYLRAKKMKMRSFFAKFTKLFPNNKIHIQCGLTDSVAAKEYLQEFLSKKSARITGETN